MARRLSMLPKFCLKVNVKKFKSSSQFRSYKKTHHRRENTMKIFSLETLSLSTFPRGWNNVMNHQNVGISINAPVSRGPNKNISNNMTIIPLYRVGKRAGTNKMSSENGVRYRSYFVGSARVPSTDYGLRGNASSFFRSNLAAAGRRSPSAFCGLY